MDEYNLDAQTIEATEARLRGRQQPALETSRTSDQAEEHLSQSVRLLWVLVDLSLLLTAFALVHWYHYGHLMVTARHTDLLLILGTVSIAQILLVKKTSVLAGATPRQGIGFIARNGIALAFVVSLGLLFFQLFGVSRFLVYGSILVFTALNMGAFSLYRRLEPLPGPGMTREKTQQLSMSAPSSLMVVDGLLLIAAFLAATWLKRGGLVYGDPCQDACMVLAGLWLATAFGTGKFKRDTFVTSHQACGESLKSVLLMAAGLSATLFFFRLGTVSRLQFFGALGLYLVLETVVFYLYVSWRQYRLIRDIEDVEQVGALVGTAHAADLPPAPARTVTDPVRVKLQHTLEFLNPELFSLLDRTLDLEALDREECSMMSTDKPLNLEMLERGGYRLLVNLGRINDFRLPNRYFILANTRLKAGGYLVGLAHTEITDRAWFASRFPRPLDSVLYGFSFIWKRVFPKLPWTNRIYFAITQGRNRMMSRTEVLGRLYFCGFRLVAEGEIDNQFCFIARKATRVCVDENPTYGPLVRLPRFGALGRPITVFKFRTMYPYSEYLQEFVYENNHLTEGGKFKDDFRVTDWGRIMRRLWLDELPMLFNWLRGDLQLIGVRPLSRQYLDLYTPELRALRQRVKPGLLPPFYADMPRTLEEIMASEERYIRAYMQKPFSTQWRYFFQCVWNIAVRRARSG